MTQEEKAKRYDEVIKKAESLYKAAEPMSGCNVIIETLFPELKESEDERIKNEMITYLSTVEDKELIPYESWIDWLKKQGEQKPSSCTNEKGVVSEREATGVLKELLDKEESEDEKIRKELINLVESHSEFYGNDWKIGDFTEKQIFAWLEKQGSEPNWCHHKVDLSDCSEEYRKAYYDGWNNCNLQHSQCKSELDDVLKCLINGMKFYYEANKDATWGTDKWSMPVKHIIEVLEKQGQHANFINNIQVGDKVTRNKDGVLVNLSQLNRVAKKDEKQGENKDILEDAVLDSNEDGLIADTIKKGKQKPAIFIPKFRVGDKLVSTKNPRLTYEVLEVGHINELGNPEYKVEIFTDGKGSNPRNIHDMECHKVDEWAKLIEQKPTDKVEPKFKVKYANSEYNVLEVKDIAGVTFYGIEDEPNHIDYVLPNNCDIVSEQKPAWSEEDTRLLDNCISLIEDIDCTKEEQNWLKSLKDRVQPQPKQEWSEDDKEIINKISIAIATHYSCGTAVKIENWLKSLRPQNRWKPSDEMLDALYRAIPENTMAISEDEMLLDKLYQGLKYGRVLSNK